MAKINTCKYCGAHVVNQHWHPEHRLAFCEGILGQIQELIKRKKIKGLPSVLATTIEFENFTTLRECLEEERKELSRKSDARIHAILKAGAMSKAGDEFDKSYPNPNAPTY